MLLAVGIGSIQSVDIWRSKGVKCLQSFRSEKNLFRFYASALALNEFIGYVNLTDCFEIWPEVAQDIEQKNRVRDFRFS